MPKPNPPPARSGAKEREREEETNPIISLDPTTPLNPQPLITDLLRTRYCIPGSVFLVESIERRVLIPSRGSDPIGPNSGRGGRQGKRRRGQRTVRLLLGDGELCIQAFVKGEMHCFVDGGSVFEGCYVRLDSFWLGAVGQEGTGGGDGEDEGGKRREGKEEVVDDGVGDPQWLEGERGRMGKEKREGKGRVVYLVVGDMVTVGWNEEYLQILRREREERERERPLQVEGGKDAGQVQGEEDVVAPIARDDTLQDVDKDIEEYEDDEIIDQLMAVEEAEEAGAAATAETTRTHTGEAEGAPSKPAPKENPDEPDYISDSDSAFETLAVSAERASQRRIATAAADPRQELQANIIKQNQQTHHHPQAHPQSEPQPQRGPQPQPQPHPQPQPITNPRPWLPTDASHPLKLTPLSQIPHLPYRQNWMVNVLAVLTSLSSVEPSHIGPSFRQRTARLADMSTPHKQGVHLTVYLDPEGFTPREGSVVLLLGVKNHMYEGGSLRKYVSDGLAGGGSWWVGEPGRLGWCKAGVERLRAWWGEKEREKGG